MFIDLEVQLLVSCLWDEHRAYPLDI
uniref:Uncharacterized protein n=1 Tax=Arundo donax TaxID=35708 RepID=A0A0A9BUI3_ARUDO